MLVMRINSHKLLAIFLNVCAIPFFLSGCGDGEDNHMVDTRIPVGENRTIAATTSLQGSLFSTTTSVSDATGREAIASTTASTTSTAEYHQPALAGSVSLKVPSSDALLADDAAMSAITQGIADVHNVPRSYVSINITKVSGRLLATSALRRLVSVVRIDYAISVPISVVTSVLDRASDVTLAMMDTAVEKAVKAEKGEAYAAALEVTFLAPPQRISTTTATTTTTSTSKISTSPAAATGTTTPTTSKSAGITATTTSATRSAGISPLTINTEAPNEATSTTTTAAPTTSATTTITTSTTTTTTRDEAADAQFLMQATFGPTRASLTSLQSSTLMAWMQNQMALPVESHRAYYRARSNPRVTVDVLPGSPRARCKLGSRWLQFAFSKADVNKNISVQNNKIYVGGVLRTDIHPSYTGNNLSAPRTCTDTPLSVYVNKGKTCATAGSNMACHRHPWWVKESFCEQSCYNTGRGYVGMDCSVGWPSFAFTGYICGVDERVAGWVGLSTSSNCKTLQGMQNLAIWFSNLDQIPQTTMSLNELRPGVMLLAQTNVSCNLGSFLRSNGKVYMHDSRLELLQNTLVNPAVAPPVASCPSVPKTFLNAKSCKMQSTCTPLHLSAAPFLLNAANLKKFYTVERKYLYEVVGLSASASPCGTASRWKRLDCSATVCNSASLSAADSSAIIAALQLQGGWLRDINVNCNSVAANARVQVGSEFFENVHIHEHNVYDFSTWVTAHPGGQSFITKWVDHGFQITFPPSHPMSRWMAGSTQNKLFLIGRMGDMVDFKALSTDLQTPALAAAFDSAGSTGYFQACGSPGEVGNDPSLGNEAPFWYIFEGSSNKHLDKDLDKPYWKQPIEHISKTQVWASKALRANDQLRQRMGWALSQIFVTGTPGFGLNPFTEFWLNYYDIFVRNAFGNYRDILREVTYSPLMGDYLTFKRNSAYDYNHNYPDENYAREIMQLFTIGLFKLHGNGSKVLDAQGNAERTYTNEDVMNFARVFTGFDEQLPRSNIEALKGARNNIDPMRMREAWHDVYPKTGLQGNYIGDGYPLCSDLPPRAFLSKGAHYNFLGHVHTDSYVKELSQDSPLYKALCGSGASCNFALEVEIGSDLTCYNEECNMDNVEVVKVANGYYEYVPPTCVHLYFSSGQISVQGNLYNRETKRKCENPDAQVAGTSCCGVVNGVQKEARICGQSSERVRFSVATANCASMGLAVCDKTTATASCGYDAIQVWTPLTCTTEIEIDSFGKVSAQTDGTTKQNQFAVLWLNGFPDVSACPSGCVSGAGACTCSVAVSTKKVFDDIPTKAALKANLFIGAFAPTVPCSTCTGDVKAFLTGGVIDETTVFECEGRYYKNMQSIGSAGGKEFRNPVAFMQAGLPTKHAALAEVEALIDHLFHHSNTPVFVSYRLIQRFGSSNPSPQYISDVAEAFKTGKYGGTVFSGLYGDLAATIAAILLHPEARNPQSATQGSLREPIVKIVHFLRSMEYADSNHSGVALNKLDDLIGQEPYQSPSVFNYYQPEYQPSSFSGDVVAPEFQIFTAPWAVGFLNGILSMIDNGVSACDKGLGYSDTNSYYFEWFCKIGEYQLQKKSNVDDTIAELNLLLTGGRLTSADIAKSAYQTAAAGDEFKAAQRAIVLSPEFHTIGNSLPAGFRAPAPAPAPSPVSSYKATVMLFMGGGADTFNMLVPYEGALWSQYQAVRKDIALASHELLNITTVGQNISKFAVHHKLPFLRQLYNDGQAAFVSNIGALVEPMTKDQYKKGAAKKCVGLFSHSDQQAAAATLKCQVAGTSPKGAGGRISDALKAQNYKAHSFSVAGTSTWSQGFVTNQEIIHANNGAVRLAAHQSINPLLQSITNRTHDNVYCEEYAKSIRNFVKESEYLGTTLDNTTLQTSYTASTGLAKQFKQVSKLIAARATRKVERDMFYVNIGGFDAHSNAAEVLDDKFTIINDALQEFVGELKAQGVFDSVAIASESDFGRSLSSNGAGTDHAWAGNHFVIGGKVNGGRIFNNFPSSLLIGSDQDLGRGRLIPKYPWESMMVPIAEWMGVQENQNAVVFPNLANFDRSKHILAKDILFN